MPKNLRKFIFDVAGKFNLDIDYDPFDITWYGFDKSQESDPIDIQFNGTIDSETKDIIFTWDPKTLDFQSLWTLDSESNSETIYP